MTQNRIISPHEHTLSGELRALMERYPGYGFAAVVFDIKRPGSQMLLNNLPNPLVAAEVMMGGAHAIVRSVLQAAGPPPPAIVAPSSEPSS